MWYHCKPIRMTYKIVTPPNAGKDVEKLDHSYIAYGSVKWYSYSGTVDSLFKNQTCKYHITQQLYSWVFIPDK